VSRQRIEKPLGLNAVGKPYGENFDPYYKMKYKPSYAHLRHPYGFSMRFVGDPPSKADNGMRRRRRQSPPVPLLDDVSALQKQLDVAHDRLHRAVLAVDKAIKKTDGLRQQLLAVLTALSTDRATPAVDQADAEGAS
jgi:hypothetical protein